MKLTRYPDEKVVTSSLNHFDDMVEWLRYLSSSDFVVSLLRETHGYPTAEAKQRAKQLLPHARYAVAYLTQVQSSPSEVSFLPAYYAILNLAKIYILAGPYASEFSHHSRWHGATYAVQEKDSHSLLTEQITLHDGGTLALFYKTLTDNPLTGKKKLRVGELYGCIHDISAEYSLATGEDPSVRYVNFLPRMNAGKLTVNARILAPNLPDGFSVRHSPALSGFHKKPGENTTFQKYVGKCDESEIDGNTRAAVDTRYLYLSRKNASLISFRRSQLKFTEEFPIALAFFHLSSICRYKPEFLDRVSRTKLWPVLLAARRHGLYKFIILTWSYLNRTDFHITTN